MTTPKPITMRLVAATMCIVLLAACGDSTDVVEPPESTNAPTAVTTTSFVDNEAAPGTTSQPPATTTTSTEPVMETTTSVPPSTTTTAAPLTPIAMTFDTDVSDANSGMPSGYGLPADYSAPSGWIESISRWNPTAGEFTDSSDDPRLDAFMWRMEGCCESGLTAAFGSPGFPSTNDATDLGDGLYMARIIEWSPSTPNLVALDVRRVVECTSDQGYELSICENYGFMQGQYEVSNESRVFYLELDDTVTVRIFGVLEPSGDDEYYTNYSWVGQSADFTDLLSNLHAVYTTLVTTPASLGATREEISSLIEMNPDFRVITPSAWAPYGVWQPAGSPAITYPTAYELFTPQCWDSEDCVGGGDTQVSPRSFESFISRLASMHVVNGRIALMLPGEDLLS